jgi:FdhE protein
MPKADEHMLKSKSRRGESQTRPYTNRNPHSATRTRLDALAHQYPEWRAWLTLLDKTLHTLDEPVWAKVEPRLRNDRPAAAPLLDGAELALDSRRAHVWVLHLFKAAAKGEGPGAASLAAGDINRLDAVALLEAAACQDHTRIQTVATTVCVEARALGAVAQLAVMPLLHACRRQLASQIPSTWTYGYCVVCGAWPTLADLCGLERLRRLRCVRCGGNWEAAWLHCPYCGESDHQRLGFLLPEGSEGTRKVETCTTCKGYVKALTTLQGGPPDMVVLDDLATVDLDLVAIERGYARPERPGYAAQVRLSERPSRLRTFLSRNPGHPSTSLS